MRVRLPCPQVSPHCSLDSSQASQGGDMPPHGLAICLLSMSSLAWRDRAPRWPIKTMNHDGRQEILPMPLCSHGGTWSRWSPSWWEGPMWHHPLVVSNILPVPHEHPAHLRVSRSVAALPNVVPSYLFRRVKCGPWELHLMTLSSGMGRDREYLTPPATFLASYNRIERYNSLCSVSMAWSLSLLHTSGIFVDLLIHQPLKKDPKPDTTHPGHRPLLHPAQSTRWQWVFLRSSPASSPLGSWWHLQHPLSSAWLPSLHPSIPPRCCCRRAGCLTRISSSCGIERPGIQTSRAHHFGGCPDFLAMKRRETGKSWLSDPQHPQSRGWAGCMEKERGGKKCHSVQS